MLGFIVAGVIAWLLAAGLLAAVIGRAIHQADVDAGLTDY